MQRRLTNSRKIGNAVAMALTLLAPPSAARAAKLEAGAKRAPQSDLGTCRFNLPKKVTTIVYDTYGGGLPSKYRLEAQPHTYLGRQEVRIPKRDTPVFLVFSSYGPTEWDLRIDPGAQIAAILVVGTNDQIVSNIPPKTDVAFSTLASGAGWDCPTGVTWTDQDLQSKLRPMLDNEFSRPIDEYYRRSSGECVYVGCGGDANWQGKSEAKPSVSLWSRMFGPSQPPMAKVAGEVRTSGPLLIREKCRKGLNALNPEAAMRRIVNAYKAPPDPGPPCME